MDVVGIALLREGSQELVWMPLPPVDALSRGEKGGGRGGAHVGHAEDCSGGGCPGKQGEAVGATGGNPIEPGRVVAGALQGAPCIALCLQAVAAHRLPPGTARPLPSASRRLVIAGLAHGVTAVTYRRVEPGPCGRQFASPVSANNAPAAARTSDPPDRSTCRPTDDGLLT